MRVEADSLVARSSRSRSRARSGPRASSAGLSPAACAGADASPERLGRVRGRLSSRSASSLPNHPVRAGAAALDGGAIASSRQPPQRLRSTAGAVRSPRPGGRRRATGRLLHPREEAGRGDTRKAPAGGRCGTSRTARARATGAAGARLSAATAVASATAGRAGRIEGSSLRAADSALGELVPRVSSA